ncbi:MAG: polysaccharide biosynthesis/export family protein [Phaeobacter italicus]
MAILLKRILMGLFVVLWAGAALAQSEYRTRTGDVLAIEVLEDPSLNRNAVILPDGRFSFPFAGSVPGRGLTVAQIQANLTASLAPNFATGPTVFVAVNPAPVQAPIASGPAAPVTIDIYLLGEVGSPGLKAMQPGTTFLQALAQSGGLTNFAATKRIQLRRGTPPKVHVINYKAITQGAQLRQNLVLQDGDVILVPERRLFE